MKVSHTHPIGAMDTGSGTTYYKVTESDLVEAVEGGNIWLSYIIESKGFDAIDIDSLYGSNIIDGELYICDTDGQDIYVDGEPVDPESALFDYAEELELLSDYIVDASLKDIYDRISLYEIKPIYLNLETTAIELLAANYTFEEVVRDARDIPGVDI